MKKLLIIGLLTAYTGSFAQLKAENVFVSFYSKMDDITAKNATVSSTLDQGTGELTFEVKIEAFEFVNKTMQKHFNQEGVMNSASFPVATYKGKIVNNEDVDYTADGKYEVTVNGTMMIKGVTKDFSAKGQIIIKEGKISAISSFDLDRFEFGVDAKEGSVSKVLAIKVEAHYK